ncbi:hypothetical protein [Amycolatopsis sp. cg9]|uniref:hypothetical protein n=1 Tax=Amycolatopsis sp. cg9 TaxID=3238801 RepID=UPI00352626D3
MRLYHPVGHRATLSFLAELAGPYQRHEQALLRALAALEASRAVWRAEAAAYVDSRVKEKRLGRRRPPPGDPPRSRMSGHWYASTPELSRRAAVHALKLWELEPGTADEAVRALVRDCTATGGRLTAGRLDIGATGWPMPLVASAAGSSK